MFYIYICLFFMVLFFELKLWKTLTPTVVVFSGITLISVLHFLFGGYLGFIEVNPKVYAYISCFLTASFGSSVFVFLLFNFTRLRYLCVCDNFTQNRTSATGSAYKPSLFRPGIVIAGIIPGRIFSNNVTVWFFSAFVLLLLIFVFYSILRAYYSLGSLTGEGFEHSLTYGIVGHSFSLLMACVPFLYMFL